jgi:hypothetical protein
MERDTPANPNAGNALPRRLRLDERFSMAQFSCLLGILNQPLMKIFVSTRPWRK